MNQQLTKADFEQAYAARSGVTVEWLHAMGLFGIPCDCGEDGCQGWEMGHFPERRGKRRIQESGAPEEN